MLYPSGKHSFEENTHQNAWWISYPSGYPQGSQMILKKVLLYILNQGWAWKLITWARRSWMFAMPLVHISCSCSLAALGSCIQSLFMGIYGWPSSSSNLINNYSKCILSLLPLRPFCKLLVQGRWFLNGYFIQIAHFSEDIEHTISAR